MNVPEHQRPPESPATGSPGGSNRYLTNRIAAVVARHSPVTGLGYSRTRCGCGEAFSPPYMKSHAAHVAEQIAAELQLTEEWAVDECGVLGKWHKTQESAQKHCDTIVRNFWVTHKGVAGAIIAEPRPVPVRRWVSASSAVEENP